MVLGLLVVLRLAAAAVAALALALATLRHLATLGTLAATHLTGSHLY